MADTSTLSVAINHAVGSLFLDLHFTIGDPWNVLFAPSGAGKTMVLRIIAGLVDPSFGKIEWSRTVAGDQSEKIVLLDTPRNISLKPQRRSAPYLGQNTPLFPHMNVIDNISFGMGRSWNREQSRASDARKQELLSLCRIRKLAKKMPSQLSNGERQRVVMARALGVKRCRVLLLDEPFTGLDIALRAQLLTDLRVWLAERNILVLHVTHDVGEIFALNPTVLRLDQGKTICQGTPATVLRDERTWLMKQLL